jgi:Na+-translocating ferredoxin:NAD+ oxidoreductase RnfC subunit
MPQGLSSVDGSNAFLTELGTTPLAHCIRQRTDPIDFEIGGAASKQISLTLNGPLSKRIVGLSILSAT